MAELGDFVRSTRCSVDGCVEVSLTHDGRIAVRGSSREDMVLYFTPDEWTAFLLGVRAGKFDYS